MVERNFVCNKTSEDFLKDEESEVKILFGCVGSGKSSTCCIALYMLARSIPAGHDGIRRSRWVIIRSTYSQLKTTTVRTWQEWFPTEVFGDVKGDSPMTHLIKHDDVEIEVMFLAIESLSDVNRLKSLEITGAYINEAQFFANEEIITAVKERCQRYPGKLYGGGFGKDIVIMDCNPPSTSHWIYKKFEIERPVGWTIYKMPPAIIKDEFGNWINNPNADFIDQLPNKNYWLDKTRGASDEYIRVSLCGQYGVVEEGRPVHPEYNDSIHYTDRLIRASDQIEIGFGWDFGNTPACIVTQQMADGQLVVLHEIWTEYMSVRQFAQNIVIPQLDKHYPFWRKNYKSVHDPSGQAMNSDGNTCQAILREVGIISMPTASNAAQFRRDSLKYHLTRMVGGQPGFLLTRNCPLLREGLMGKFKYEVIKSTLLMDNKDYQEKPLKNIYSHSCEALEYISGYYAGVVKSATTVKIDSVAMKIQEANSRLNQLRARAIA